MKSLVSVVICFLITIYAGAQNTGILKNQKDAWDIEYTYTGELKNGVPNGMGVAQYSNGTVTRYVGNFVNGFYNGKGVMLFENGAFLCGTWKNGKLNGKGTNLTNDGQLYIGDFLNGLKNGQGILFYKDNGFVKGGFANDKLNGRCIYLWADGKILSDSYYADDKRNGDGYQYEAASKTLFQGEWSDDKWVQSTTPSFTSFLQAPSFTGEITDDHVLMGPVTSDGHLRDTSYYYNLDKHKRYFGYYEDGFIKNGIQIRDDSTRFIGEVDDKGAQGFCYDFKFGNYYSEGGFKDDYLDGDIIDIDLKKKSVYMGKSVLGEYTGKAYFFNGSGTMYSGDYVQGRFTGQGYRVETFGRTVAGTWEDGVPKTVTSLITSKGESVNPNPKTFAEAMNMVAKQFYDYYDDISGSITDESDDLLDFLDDGNDDYSDYYNSLISFPGSVGVDLTRTNFDSTNLYITTLFKSPDIEKARAKYNEIAKQIQAVTITNKYLSKPGKLQGTIVPPDMRKSKNEIVFDLAATEDEYSRFHVWLKMRKDDDDNFVITVEIGELTDED